MLVSAGLDERMAVSLVTIENFLAAGIEPVMGGLSDRWQVWLGTKMPLIAAGAIASAGLFILLPLSVTLAVPNSGTWLIGLGYRARIRNHGHSCFLCEIVIRSQFHTTYEPEA
jgi:hypothetical protein